MEKRFGGIVWPPNGAAGREIAFGASCPLIKPPGAAEGALLETSGAASRAAEESLTLVGREATGVERRNRWGADFFPGLSDFAEGDPEAGIEDRDEGGTEAAAAAGEPGPGETGEGAVATTGAVRLLASRADEAG